LTLLVGRQEGHPARKKYGGMVELGNWLVRMEWRPAGWSVCLPLLISLCTIKFRSSLLAPAHPVVPEKGPCGGGGVGGRGGGEKSVTVHANKHSKQSIPHTTVWWDNNIGYI